MELKGKVALVTGGSRGIGRETAILLASHGASVAICARNQFECEEVADYISTTYGTPTVTIICDVENENEVKKSVEKVKIALGSIDILINNAGTMLLKSFIDTTTQEWQKMFGINVNGPFYFTKAVIEHMKEKKEGSIVNISSIWGTKGGPNRSAYIASKHAIIGFSKALGEEMKPYNIRVNAVCPGPVDTKMTEALGSDLDKTGWLHPIDIAYVIANLVLPKNRAITATSIEAFGAGSPVGFSN